MTAASGDAVRSANEEILAWLSPLILGGTIFGVHLWLFGDREWVHAVLQESFDAAARVGEAEGTEEAMAAMEAALDSGAIGVLLGARAIWTLSRSHFLFWGLVFPLALTLAGRWDRLREMAIALSAALWILAAGVAANGLLRWISVRMQGTFSPAFLLDWFDGRLILHDLAIKSDFFLLAYLWVVAGRWSGILGEGRHSLAAVILLLWLLLTVASFYLSYSFALSF